MLAIECSVLVICFAAIAAKHSPKGRLRPPSIVPDPSCRTDGELTRTEFGAIVVEKNGGSAGRWICAARKYRPKDLSKPQRLLCPRGPWDGAGFTSLCSAFAHLGHGRHIHNPRSLRRTRWKRESWPAPRVTARRARGQITPTSRASPVNLLVISRTSFSLFIRGAGTTHR